MPWKGIVSMDDQKGFPLQLSAAVSRILIYESESEFVIPNADVAITSNVHQFKHGF